jgi:hypothetical protein
MRGRQREVQERRQRARRRRQHTGE